MFSCTSPFLIGWSEFRTVAVRRVVRYVSNKLIERESEKSKTWYDVAHVNSLSKKMYYLDRILPLDLSWLLSKTWEQASLSSRHDLSPMVIVMWKNTISFTIQPMSAKVLYYWSHWLLSWDSTSGPKIFLQRISNQQVSYSAKSILDPTSICSLLQDTY